jgi:TadE-like protein
MPIRSKRRRHVSEDGQALIETAVVLPLILVLLLIVIDFGIALDRRELILHSLREAGRSAVAGASVAEIQQRALSESDGALKDDNSDGVLDDLNQVPVCYLNENGNGVLGDAGDVVRVRINFEYNLTVGSGEMLSAFGVPKPTVDISPTAEVLLAKGVAGPVVPQC